mgnify:CR=1 FL=1
MRAKRPYIVLSFRTTVEAMAWEKHCEAEHIPGRLIPLPRELSAGCGLAWKAEPGDRQALLDALAQAGLACSQCAVVEMF